MRFRDLAAGFPGSSGRPVASRKHELGLGDHMLLQSLPRGSSVNEKYSEPPNNTTIAEFQNKSSARESAHGIL